MFEGDAVRGKTYDDYRSFPRPLSVFPERYKDEQAALDAIIRWVSENDIGEFLWLADRHGSLEVFLPYGYFEIRCDQIDAGPCLVIFWERDMTEGYQ